MPSEWEDGRGHSRRRHQIVVSGQRVAELGCPADRAFAECPKAAEKSNDELETAVVQRATIDSPPKTGTRSNRVVHRPACGPEAPSGGLARPRPVAVQQRAMSPARPIRRRLHRREAPRKDHQTNRATVVDKILAPY